MVTYMPIPQLKVVVGATTFQADIVTRAHVIRRENGFDTATVVFSDYQSKNRATIIKGAAITISVKDNSEAAWTTVFVGVIRFVTETVPAETITAKCDGAGYGFCETVCAQEYGVQSNNPTLDTIQLILTNATTGIVPAWVNHTFGDLAEDTGYAYVTTSGGVDYVDPITGSINYLYFPYKPNNKCLNDICTVIQAIKGAAAGPHWIVTTDDKLLVTTVGSHSAASAGVGWTTYYGNSATAATLVQGTDFTTISGLETMSPEANYILYHGAWQKPGNGDAWTEDNAAAWTGVNIAVTDSHTCKVPVAGVGHSILGTVTVKSVDEHFYYPTTDNLHLDLDAAGGKYNVPSVNFWARRNAALTLGASPDLMAIDLGTNWGAAIVWSCAIDLTKFLVNADQWYHMSIPVSQYWRTAETTSDAFREWQPAGGGGDWTDINRISFTIVNKEVDSGLYIDGLCFAGWCLRGAKWNNPVISAANPLKLKVINDPFGKDDTLDQDITTGTIARMAYAELLRCKTTPTVGTFTTPMMKDLLPGQLVHVHARPNSAGAHQVNMDMRESQVEHDMSEAGFITTHSVTSDVVNSMSRQAFDSYNQVLTNVRPEFQDRQSTGIKMRELDITQKLLENVYP